MSAFHPLRTLAHYCARFPDRDEDVNLDTGDPEFRAWKWAEPERLPEMIVRFKRELYRRLLLEFADYL